MMKYGNYILYGAVYFLLYAPALLYAQPGGPSEDTGVPGPSPKDDFGVPGGSAQLENPLGSQTLIGFFNDILDVILVFAVPIIVFFIIFAGFKFVMARGKPEEIESAKKALLYAVIGGVLILGAKVLLVVIQGTIEALSI